MNKKVRFRQRDITDCGAACLASVAAHFGLKMPVSRIRQIAGTDQRGTNVNGLIEAAEKLGFQAKGAKGPIESLAKIPLPAIAHLALANGLHHYVVLVKVSKTDVWYMDPGDGRFHKRRIADFGKLWTGIIVLLLPQEAFVSGDHTVSNRDRFWQLIKPHGSLLMHAMVASIIYTILGLSTSIYVQKIIDVVLPEGNIRLLNLLGTGMLLLLSIQIFFNIFKGFIGLQTGQHIDARLILGYYQHLLRLPQRFFDTMRVGEIISRVNDAVKIRMFINDVALSIIVNLLIVFFSVGIMFFYYWKLAMIALTIIPLYLVLFMISNRLNRKYQRVLMENSADLETQLVESLNAAGTIKRFGLENYANLRTENKFIVLLRNIYKSSVFTIGLSNVSEFLSRALTIAVLWAGCYFVADRELSPGELLSFYALIGYLTGPAAMLIGSNKSIQDAMIAADRLFEIIDLETEATKEARIEMTRELVGDIQLNDVHFRYGTRAKVFSGLDLTFRKGEATAVVGESGSGKSTLLSLLQNLYPLNQGNITIGGTDVGYISRDSLRKLVSVVPQQVDLFAGTLVENIAVGEPEPDLNRVLQLSRMLGIDEFVEKLPGAYFHTVSERGNNFSGGQRQRIAIARALYRDPEILILDEATANLDLVSEHKVQEVMQWFVARGKTLIVIAHRLASIRNCSRIVVLKEGRIAEEGSHDQLLHIGGYYSLLWHRNAG